VHRQAALKAFTSTPMSRYSVVGARKLQSLVVMTSSATAVILTSGAVMRFCSAPKT